MSFKEAAAQDIRNVFLNLDEFGEKRNVRYDGTVYEDVTLVFQGPVKGRRGRQAAFGQTRDNVPGLHALAGVLQMAAADLGGVVPKQGARIEISVREGGRFFERYHISTSENQMGMLRLELEAIDQ